MFDFISKQLDNFGAQRRISTFLDAMLKVQKDVDIRPTKNSHQLSAKTNSNATVRTFFYVLLICESLECVKRFFRFFSLMMNLCYKPFSVNFSPPRRDNLAA